MLIEIAKTDFDLNDYDKSFLISQEIINNSFTTPETKGKAYNLLGLIDIYNKGDYETAIHYLNQAADIYEKEKLHVQALGIEINLGNLYHMLEDNVRAEDHWNKAYEMNNIVGDLDKEGKLLLNSGIFSYNYANYDDARERYEKAANIFRTIGNRSNLALVLTNLGELFLTLCEYTKAEKYLLESRKLFQELENHEEEAETLLILAKYFYTAGNEKKIKLLLSDYKDNLEVYQLSEKYQIIYKYLFLLVNIESDPVDESINKLVGIRETFIEWNERGLIYETTILLCELYLAEDNYEGALDLLNSELFLKIIENNDVFYAEREYMYGNIASLTELPGLGSPIEYFENAFQIIKEKNIIELTWKICYGLGLTYFERGIVLKAAEYIEYAQNLLFLMAENFESPTLRTHFLSKENRRKALAKLRACKRKMI